MTIAERTASTTWAGNLARGTGTIRAGSGAFDPLPLPWAARTETPGALYPISRLFAGAKLTVDATLE